MNTEHIRAFLEVTATGSFQEAAEKLHVTQSTVSARIKALEDRLNRTLFYRKRNGVELTTGGHHFHPNAVNLIAAWERAKQDVGLPEGVTAMVTLGVQDNHWHRIVPSWLGWMESTLPTLATSVMADSSERMMQKLRAGLLDLAVLYDPQQCEEVSIEPLLTEDLVMVSTIPRSVASGVVPGYVYVDWGDSFRAQHSLRYPGTFSHKLTVRLAAVGLEHILAQGGSGYFLESAVAPLISAGKLHRVEGAPVFLRPIFLAVRNQPVDNDLLNLAVEGIRQMAKKSSSEQTSTSQF
jgi:DNA-binding transcriptional LysR family regulator